MLRKRVVRGRQFSVGPAEHSAVEDLQPQHDEWCEHRKLEAEVSGTDCRQEDEHHHEPGDDAVENTALRVSVGTEPRLYIGDGGSSSSASSTRVSSSCGSNPVAPMSSIKADSAAVATPPAIVPLITSLFNCAPPYLNSNASPLVGFHLVFLTLRHYRALTLNRSLLGFRELCLELFPISARELDEAGRQTDVFEDRVPLLVAGNDLFAGDVGHGGLDLLQGAPEQVSDELLGGPTGEHFGEGGEAGSVIEG
jgi:hypothetical protein